MTSRGWRKSQRRDRSLKRVAGRQPGKPTLLVVCEGETEQMYLEALKRHLRVNSAYVLIADNTVGSNPGSVVKCALDHYRQFAYDHVYCVFDRDAHADFDATRVRIRDLRLRKSKKIPIHEAISVPCVELWFLLHFGYWSAPVANFAAIRTPLRTHIAGYEKADASIAAMLVQRHPDAVTNARRLVDQARAEEFENPYTNFHELVEHIQSLAG